ncbi:MAG: 50S ribosomal protein L18 [Gemmatimonadota bacterium]
MSSHASAERRRNRARRHTRVRKKVRGSEKRPRLVVFRSLRHTEGQLVDDDRGVTVVGVSTRALDGVSSEEMSAKVAASFEAGKRLAERAREAGVEKAVFDRGGYRYHGRVKAFADGARAGGLEF